jgi:hypothetical protein
MTNTEKRSIVIEHSSNQQWPTLGIAKAMQVYKDQLESAIRTEMKGIPLNEYPHYQISLKEWRDHQWFRNADGDWEIKITPEVKITPRTIGMYLL